jgi:hypothetical protein
MFDFVTSPAATFSKGRKVSDLKAGKFDAPARWAQMVETATAAFGSRKERALFHALNPNGLVAQYRAALDAAREAGLEDPLSEKAQKAIGFFGKEVKKTAWPTTAALNAAIAALGSEVVIVRGLLLPDAPAAEAVEADAPAAEGGEADAPAAEADAPAAEPVEAVKPRRGRRAA